VLAVVRQWSYVPGLELLITLNGALRWARLYREASDLERDAEHKRQELTNRGWTPEQPQGRDSSDHSLV
jgi:hypothetical protein